MVALQLNLTRTRTCGCEAVILTPVRTRLDALLLSE